MDELFRFFVVVAFEQSKNRKQAQQEPSTYVDVEGIRHVRLCIFIRDLFQFRSEHNTE